MCVACDCAGLCIKSIIWQKKKAYCDKGLSGTFLALHLCVLVIGCGDVKYLCGIWNTSGYSSSIWWRNAVIASGESWHRAVLGLYVSHLQIQEESFKLALNRAHRDNILQPVSLGQ